MSLEEKTKKWGCYHCSCCRFYHGFAKGCELPGGCAYILVSFAEADKREALEKVAWFCSCCEEWHPLGTTCAVYEVRKVREES